ncbi:hypothetical protein V1478_016306 [Vespula squamosa]|uniref:Uncharacterized protein n=1 Tax=Vespula squamosa TaxID=30214 RepID=A0ABD1ZZF2_VESSQ
MKKYVIEKINQCWFKSTIKIDELVHKYTIRILIKFYLKWKKFDAMTGSILHYRHCFIYNLINVPRLTLIDTIIEQFQ